MLIILVIAFISIVPFQLIGNKESVSRKLVSSLPSPTVTHSPTISPTPTSTPPTNTPVPTKIPQIAATVKFVTLPIGSILPEDQECAEKVKRSAFEPRPQNSSANNTVASGGPYIDDVFRAERITGNFTGTTDEIIQWGACKWGFDEDIVRAVAVQESWWRMSDIGDKGQSFGLLQVKRTVHDNTYPASANSTAFNVDYSLSYRRACFEGQHTWMKKKNSSYTEGDEWGCVGSWFSGNWYNGDVNVAYSGANWYIEEVKRHLQNRTWARADF